MTELEIKVIILEECVKKIMKALFNVDYDELVEDVKKKVEGENK